MRDTSRHHSGTNFTNGQKSRRNASRTGFTIVELLVVVVVIAILAAITIVAYNGITNQARDSALKADLTTTAKKVGLIQAETGAYPMSKPDGLPNTIQYSGGGGSFCATAASDGRAFHITEEGNIQDGACDGHEAGGGDGNEIVANSPIQNVTPAQCRALPTFVGSNEAAVRTVTDSRGGTNRTYQIAKLADGNCWMLANLKLGSTNGPITLTPADSDVGSDFTLPQLLASGSNAHDLPRVYGPVPGDTGSGATNYAFLYNWAAATAGESRATHGSSDGDAPYSICPSGWQLPSSGLWRENSNTFSTLNARMAGFSDVTDDGYAAWNYYSAANAANWLFTGQFKGTFAGLWGDGTFYDQGDWGYLWSRSVATSDVNRASYTGFDTGVVMPGDAIDERYAGFGVRCLLKEDVR